VKTYVFRVVVEPDDDRWSAYCPVLEKYGAATWGYTKEEALKNIQEVVEMIIGEMVEEKELIPEGPSEEVFVSFDPRVAVTI
jgi:predicted RNase H-like HicB family nuclease